MDIYEAMYTTRAMRRLKPDPIPYDVQARILDAAIRAPHIGEGWRFILVDDPKIKSQLAPLYRQGFERMIGGAPEVLFADVIKADTQMGRTVRSGLHLVNHFAEVPLFLIGFGRTKDGAGIYPALQNAMLAARAEGVGSTLTGFLQSYFANEVMDILGVPKDDGWTMHGVVPMGYPTGKWGVGARKPVHEIAARNITSGEFAYRLDIIGGFVIHIIFIILVVSLYNLFKAVDRKQAMLMVLMVSLGVGISLVNLLNKFSPLILLSGAEYLSVFTKPQLEALALGFLRLHSSGANLAIAFWGLWLFPFGILVMQSGFIPKIFGILLIVAGVGYFVTSFTSIVLPALRPVLAPIMTPLYLGELPIIFWLAIKGVMAQKIDARALQTDRI